MLRGVFPIVLIPFNPDGSVDEKGLRQITQFELAGGVDGIGVNGFASEAYKLTDDERKRTAAIVAEEVNGTLPLIIGIAPVSTHAAVEQARYFAQYNPAALMTLPPATMDNGIQAHIDHYVTLAKESDTPIMVQQSPHIPAYRHCELPPEALAEMADRAHNIRSFKIEGAGAAERIAALRPLVSDEITLLGGGGGLTLADELRAGAVGVIPGVGFNEYFVRVWAAWQSGDQQSAQNILQAAQPLVDAVSSKGHEYSLHARKHLMKRAGYIHSAFVRQPTIPFDENNLETLFQLVDSLNIRISQPKAS